MKSIAKVQSALLIGLLACSLGAHAAKGAGGGGGGGNVAPPFFVTIPDGSAPQFSATPLVGALPNLTASTQLLALGRFSIGAVYASSNIVSTNAADVPAISLVSGPTGASVGSAMAIAGVQIHGTWYNPIGGATIVWIPTQADIGQTFPFVVQATTPGGTVQSSFSVTVIDQPSAVANLIAARLSDRFAVQWDSAVGGAGPLTYTINACGVVTVALGGAGVLRAPNTVCQTVATTSANAADIPLTVTSQFTIGTLPAGSPVPADLSITVTPVSSDGVAGVPATIASPQ
jgi:hypothetical protein